jgi:hypothetical protein
MDYSYYMKSPFYEFSQQLTEEGNTDTWSIEGANHGSLQYIITDYAASITVTLQVSNDGTNWINYKDSGAVTSNTSGMIFLNEKVNYARAKYTGTGKVKLIFIGG